MTKIILAATTAIVLTTASAAFAGEDPASKIGDRYPWLEPIAQADVLDAFAKSSVRSQRRNAHAVTPFTTAEKALFDRAVGHY